MASPRKRTTETKVTAKKVVEPVKPIVKAAPEAPKSVKREEKPKIKVTPEERHRLVERAAYFRAEKNGFQGDASIYWKEAEAEVEAYLNGKK
mgnify:FL=1